jgi:hypothetical protein
MTTIICDRYLALDGERELVLLAGIAGSRLLVDRRDGDGGDARLLAHLSADEPDANARFVCCEFLRDPCRTARRLAPSDFLVEADGAGHEPPVTEGPAVLVDVRGFRYALRAGPTRELRWEREMPDPGAVARRLSARAVIGALEDYEPVCGLTRDAVVRHRDDRRVSVSALAIELRRIETSPIVLNRRLREAVLDAVRQRGISLSAIAMACGRIKRDRRGNGSGETSWLARRVGLLPSEAGGRPNPWVHSDTLALIAREGLGLAPRDVELP